MSREVLFYETIFPFNLKENDSRKMFKESYLIDNGVHRNENVNDRYENLQQNRTHSDNENEEV